MIESVKTKLKFSKSTKSNSYVGFITINNVGAVRGVREDSTLPKKVCILSQDIDQVIENVLYDVELVPMKNGKAGYVVISAEPHLFKAKIETVLVKNALYKVEVSFGNKTIVYDPMDGIKYNVKTIKGVTSVLESRKDIENLPEVIEKFERAANMLLMIFEQDGHYVNRD